LIARHMMQSFRTVISDWCGTMESNLQPRLQKIVTLCKKVCIPIPTTGLLIYMAGMSHEQCRDNLLIDATAQQRKDFDSLWDQTPSPASNLLANQDTLTWLSANTHFCLFTNATETTIQQKIEYYALHDLFEVIATVDRFPPKPDPAMLAHIQLELAVAASSCLVVGDHLNDLAAARAAGMHCAIVKTGLVSDEMIDAWPMKPDYICDDINDIPALIKNH
jgi:HAD superfamily hydrolase (TIGR01549 family)